MIVNFLELIFFWLQILGVLVFCGLWIIIYWLFFWKLPNEYAQGDINGVYE